MTEGAAHGRRTWADSWKAPALLVAATAAAFLPALSGQFTFDDFRFIVHNEHVQATPSWTALFTDAGTADPTFPWGIVRPMRTFEFAADRALFGSGPLAFHVHSLLWHLAAAVFLLFVLRRLLGDGRAAFFAALLWAVHPSHVESVAWISSRGDVGMGACALASILFALRSKGFDRDLAASLAAAALAVLYKETGIVVGVVVVVLRLTKLTRAPVWPHLVVIALYAPYHLLARTGTGLYVSFVLGGSFPGTLATVTRGFGWYLCQTFLPSFSQDWYLSPSTSFADGAAVAWLAVHVALVWSAVAAWKREPRWTAAVAVFYFFFAPASNLLVSVSIPTTERFMYVPLAGAALAAGLAFLKAPRGVLVAATVAAAAFGALTAKRSTFWHDERRLWTEVVADHESPRGREAIAEGTETEALELRDAASAMQPGPARDEAQARSDRLLEEALAHAHQSIDDTYAFEMVARSKSVAAMRAEYNASNMCFWLGRYAEALFHADAALEVNSDRAAEPHYDRALALSGLGFAPQAIDAMRRARALSPKRPDPGMSGFFMRMGADCGKRELYMTARAAFEAAVESAPPGQIADQAQRLLDMAYARPRSIDEDKAEAAAVAKLDADLAALPRSCPVRRDHAVRR